MERSSFPTKLETEVLSILWNHPSSTVNLVAEQLSGTKQRAYTTVLTVLQNLRRKGLVTIQKSGRGYLYLATPAAQEVIDTLARNFITLHGGSLGEAILRLLSLGKMTLEEISTIEHHINTHQNMAKKKTAKKKPVSKKAPKKKVAKKATKKAVTKKKVAAKKKTAKKAAKKTVAKKKVAKKKVAKKKVAKKKVVAKKKATKKASKKKVAPKKKVAKKAAKKKVAKKKVTRKKK